MTAEQRRAAQAVMRALSNYDFDVPNAACIRECHKETTDLMLELQMLCEPHFKLPLTGQVLWRILDQAVQNVTDTNLGDALMKVDRLQDWFVAYYNLAALNNRGIPKRAKPKWDPVSRELRYGGQLCKRFSRQAMSDNNISRIEK